MRPPALPEEADTALALRIHAAAPGVDVEAEAELCRRFGPRIRLYGLRHLRNEAGAADLRQEVLLMTLQKLRAGAVREPGQLGSFVLGTCRQMVVDGRRGTARRERLLETYAADLPFDIDEHHDTPPEARLQDCLNRLPDRERNVLVLTFYDDRAADAVGRDLGISAGNVRVIRHRGIERLRDCLEVREVAS